MKRSDDLTKFAQSVLFDDEFSIWTQIYRLLYDNTVFRVLRQINAEAKQTGLETALSNYFISYMANTWYLTTATLGIARLCDNRRDVISLPVVLTKFRRFASRGLIDGLTVREWEQDYSAIPVENLKDYRDKYLAHQANEISRHHLGNDWDLDHSLIDQCEERIVRLAHNITAHILDVTSLPLPVPPFIAWERSNHPLVPKALNVRLHEIWDQHEQKIAEWVGVSFRHPDVLP